MRIYQKTAPVGDGRWHYQLLFRRPTSHLPRKRDPNLVILYADNCAVCHGEKLEGAAQGSPLLGAELKHGASMSELVTSITQGYPDKGMPTWQDALSTEQIKSLALWISENRSGLLYSDFKIHSELTIPTSIQHSQHHSFVIDTVTSDIDPLPFSIAPSARRAHSGHRKNAWFTYRLN